MRGVIGIDGKNLLAGRGSCFRRDEEDLRVELAGGKERMVQCDMLGRACHLMGVRRGVVNAERRARKQIVLSFAGSDVARNQNETVATR